MAVGRWEGIRLDFARLPAMRGRVDVSEYTDIVDDRSRGFYNRDRNICDELWESAFTVLRPVRTRAALGPSVPTRLARAGPSPLLLCLCLCLCLLKTLIARPGDPLWRPVHQYIHRKQSLERKSSETYIRTDEDEGFRVPMSRNQMPWTGGQPLPLRCSLLRSVGNEQRKEERKAIGIQSQRTRPCHPLLCSVCCRGLFAEQQRGPLPPALKSDTEFVKLRNRIDMSLNSSLHTTCPSTAPRTRHVPQQLLPYDMGAGSAVTSSRCSSRSSSVSRTGTTSQREKTNARRAPAGAGPAAPPRAVANPAPAAPGLREKRHPAYARKGARLWDLPGRLAGKRQPLGALLAGRRRTRTQLNAGRGILNAERSRMRTQRAGVGPGRPSAAFVCRTRTQVNANAAERRTQLSANAARDRRLLFGVSGGVSVAEFDQLARGGGGAAGARRRRAAASRGVRRLLDGVVVAVVARGYGDH
eukprot:gene262-biopygen3007